MVEALCPRTFGLPEVRHYFLPRPGKYGRFLLERHNVIEKFLVNIGITENLLSETELIEHSISKNTMANIDMLNRFFETHPAILDEFRKFREPGFEKTDE